LPSFSSVQRLLAPGGTTLETRVNESDLIESVLGTEGREENEEASNSISICGGSVFRCAIIRRDCFPQTRFYPRKIQAVTEHL
jgi:hypothetical protein